MKALENKFEDILAKRCIGKGKIMLATPHNIEVEQVNVTGFIQELIKAVENYFKQSGKRGGNTTKQRHPNHLKEISKKGVEARRKKNEA